MLALCPSERQAQFIARELDVPVPEGDPLTLFGEEPHVVRVVKRPAGWQVENWPLSALHADSEVEARFVEAMCQTETDVTFP